MFSRCMTSTALAACLMMGRPHRHRQSGAKNGECGTMEQTRQTPTTPARPGHADNFTKIRWLAIRQITRSKSGNNLESTPLMVNALCFRTAGTRRSVVAIDAAQANCCGSTRTRRRAR